MTKTQNNAFIIHMLLILQRDTSNKEPNYHIIGEISWALFHNRDLSGFSHEWNKDTECIAFGKKTMHSNKELKNKKSYFHIDWHTYLNFIREDFASGKMKSHVSIMDGTVT